MEGDAQTPAHSRTNTADVGSCSSGPSGPAWVPSAWADCSNICSSSSRLTNELRWARMTCRLDEPGGGSDLRGGGNELLDLNIGRFAMADPLVKSVPRMIRPSGTQGKPVWLQLTLGYGKPDACHQTQIKMEIRERD